MTFSARRQAGMSLIEATIILMILALLTAVAAPALSDYVSEAKHTKAKEDIEAIGGAIKRLTRDVGPCLKFTPATACTMENRVEILHSQGSEIPQADIATTATDFSSASNITSALNWNNDDTANVGDSMADQLSDNVPNYDTPAESSPTGYTLSGPRSGLGWRGAYIPGEVGPDPWGKRYLANVLFLAVASDASDNSNEGGRTGGWSRDVIVISAGPNVKFDTPFGGSTNYGAGKLGDDLIYTVSGDTR